MEITYMEYLDHVIPLLLNSGRPVK
jgi:hypothetical protein